MAVIKCSLEKDGRLKVLEVLEFERGDVITLRKSAGAKRTLNSDLVAAIIPCPGSVKGIGGDDCWGCITSFDRKKVVEKPE
jgi:hypothetical protein